jgi:uncharacterized protein YhjY with autotransporter beta-barrel domain
VTVAVSAAAIDAVADDFSGSPVIGASGGTTASVLGNDTLNGSGATTGSVTLSQQSTTNVGVTLNTGTGAISVAAGTAAGTYTVTYQICEQLNASNCDTASVTVAVGAAAIDAVNDSGSVASGASGGTAVANVLGNDTLNGSGATTGTVTLSQQSSTHANVTLNTGTGAVDVAAGTPANSYTVTYQICEQLNPSNCDTATVAVTVGAASIAAVADAGTIADGAVGGTAVANVLGNDTLGGSTATPATVTLTQQSTTNANVTLNAGTGAVNVAAGTPAGTYSVSYQICEQLNPSNCSTASVTVTVTAAAILSIGPASLPDGDEMQPYTAQPTVSGAPGPFTFSISAGTLPPGLSVNPSTGEIVGTPTADGSFTFTLYVQDGNGNYGSRQYTMAVVARPDPAADPEVQGLIGSEFDMAGRFAEGQLANVARHLEGLRDDDCSTAPDDETEAGGDEKPLCERGFSFWGSVTADESRNGAYEAGSITGGVDWRLSDDFVLGLAASAAYGSDDVGTNGSGVDALGEAVTGYFLYNPLGGLYVEGSLGWGSLNMGVDRYVTQSGEFASSDREAEVVFGSLGLDYELQLGAVRLSPYARYEFIDITLDGAAENGASPDNLTYLQADRRVHSLVTGARASMSFDSDWGTIAPYLRLERRERSLGGYEQLIAYSDDLGTLYALREGSSSDSVWSMAVGARADLELGVLNIEFGSSGTDGGIFRDFVFRVEFRVAQ